MAFNDYVGGLPSSVIEIGGHLFYFADFLIILLIAAFLILVLHKELRHKINKQLFIAILIFTLYGLITVILGISGHNIYRDIIGDFRRYFYYIWAIFVPMILLRDNNDIKIVEKIIYTAAPVICLFAFYRIITGQTYFPEVHDYEFDYFRAMGFHDYLILVFIICISLGKLIYESEKPNRLARIYIILLPFFVIASNFRIAWILLLFCPAIVLFLFRFQNISIRPILKKVSISIAIIFFILIIAKATGNETYKEIESRFLSSVVNFSFEETTRDFMWSKVISEWRSDPLFGAGAGENIFFMRKSWDGDWYWARAGSIHNSYLEFGLKFGVLGLILFIILQFIIIRNCVQIFRTKKDHKPIAAAAIAFILAALIQTGIQPFYTEPNSIVLIYFITGTVLSIQNKEERNSI